MLAKSRTPHGFTLIEILIAIVIFGSFTGIAVGRYRDFNRTQQIKQLGKTLVNSLRDIQSRATAQLKPDIVGACHNQDLTGYQVYFDNSGSTTNCTSGIPCLYTRIVCNNAQQGDNLIVMQLPANFTFSDTTNGLIFKILGQGTDITAGSNRYITISNQVSSSTFNFYRVCVRASGDIYDCGFKLGVASPTGLCTSCP